MNPGKSETRRPKAERRPKENRNPKPEGRKKSEDRKKSEIGSPKPKIRTTGHSVPAFFGFRISDFGLLSAFGFRISDFLNMIALLAILAQTLLLLALAPLISGCIRNWKAKLQNRRGPPPWQP
jgi:hypothetical protein